MQNGHDFGDGSPRLRIEWPWSMTWMEYVDEMLAFLKSQIGPGHRLHRRKLYVAAVKKDAKAWLVEGETGTLGCGG